MPRGKAAKTVTDEPTGATAAQPTEGENAKPAPMNPLEILLRKQLERLPILPVYVGTTVLDGNDPRLTGKNLAPLIRVMRQELQNIVTPPKADAQ